MTTLIPKFEQPITNAVNRAINLKLQETISVGDFGAVGDGITDDTAAIQLAIDSVPDNATLTFNGSYKLSGAGISINHSVNLIGIDQTTFLIDAITSGLYAVNYPQASTARYVFIKNFIFFTTAISTPTQKALYVHCQIYIENCIFKNMAIGAYLDNANGIYVHSSTFLGCAVGIQLNGTANQNYIDECAFFYCPTGVSNASILMTEDVSIPAGPLNVMITNCWFEVNDAIDINAGNSGNIFIDGCWFETVVSTLPRIVITDFQFGFYLGEGTVKISNSRFAILSTATTVANIKSNCVTLENLAISNGGIVPTFNLTGTQEAYVKGVTYTVASDIASAISNGVITTGAGCVYSSNSTQTTEAIGGFTNVNLTNQAFDSSFVYGANFSLPASPVSPPTITHSTTAGFSDLYSASIAFPSGTATQNSGCFYSNGLAATAGQYIRCSFWIKGNVTGNLEVALAPFVTSIAVSTQWTRIDIATIAPSTGTYFLYLIPQHTAITVLVDDIVLIATNTEITATPNLINNSTTTAVNYRQGDALPFYNLGPIKVTYGAAIPTGGTWAVGDRILNTAVAVGSPKGWVCTVAGAPGTWVSEGNL